MDVIGTELLFKFKLKYSDVRKQIDAWLCEAKEAQWKTSHDIKARYQSASILWDSHVVFDFKGGHYRLLVKINYLNKIVLIKKIGTHSEYDKWGLK